VAELTPRIWKEKFGDDFLTSDLAWMGGSNPIMIAYSGDIEPLMIDLDEVKDDWPDKLDT